MRVVTLSLVLILPALASCGEDRPTSFLEPAEMSGPSGSVDVPAFGEDGALALPEPEGLPSRRTRAMAHEVNRAVQAWAADGDGTFPHTTNQRNALGKSMIDYLPRGRLLMNQFTLAFTEPVDGAAATYGQIGYLPVVYPDRVGGYVITAMGDDLRRVYTISLDPY